MTNEEAARLLQLWLDGDPLPNEEPIEHAIKVLRSPGAGAMREAAAKVAEYYEQLGHANPQWKVSEKIRALPLPAPEVLEDDAFLYACNACEWVGRGGETVAMKHGHPHHLCPECHETTEPYTADQVSRLINVPAPKVADTKIHAADEWAEEDGDVLWWRFPIVEPPHLGSPLETDWDEDYGYTHWTRFVVPEESSWPK